MLGKGDPAQAAMKKAILDAGEAADPSACVQPSLTPLP